RLRRLPPHVDQDLRRSAAELGDLGRERLGGKLPADDSALGERRIHARGGDTPAAEAEGEPPADPLAGPRLERGPTLAARPEPQHPTAVFVLHDGYGAWGEVDGRDVRRADVDRDQSDELR